MQVKTIMQTRNRSARIFIAGGFRNSVGADYCIVHDVPQAECLTSTRVVLVLDRPQVLIPVSDPTQTASGSTEKNPSKRASLGSVGFAKYHGRKAGRNFARSFSAGAVQAGTNRSVQLKR
jgi:hypothetical protein